MKNKFRASENESLGSSFAYIARLIYVFAPLLILELDLMISIFLLVIIMIVPLWGEVLRSVLYVWAFTVALERPVDYISVIFFVCAALYVLEYVLRITARRRQ